MYSVNELYTIYGQHFSKPVTTASAWENLSRINQFTSTTTIITMTTDVAMYQKIFREAVSKGDAMELQRVLEERPGKVNVNCFDHEGQTALHQSCIEGNLQLVKLLVQFGADVRLANRDGWSALHIAAYGGHQEIMLYLINVNRRWCPAATPVLAAPVSS